MLVWLVGCSRLNSLMSSGTYDYAYVIFVLSLSDQTTETGPTSSSTGPSSQAGEPVSCVTLCSYSSQVPLLLPPPTALSLPLPFFISLLLTPPFSLSLKKKKKKKKKRKRKENEAQDVTTGTAQPGVKAGPPTLEALSADQRGLFSAVLER